MCRVDGVYPVRSRSPVAVGVHLDVQNVDLRQVVLSDPTTTPGSSLLALYCHGGERCSKGLDSGGRLRRTDYRNSGNRIAILSNRSRLL